MNVFNFNAYIHVCTYVYYTCILINCVCLCVCIYIGPPSNISINFEVCLNDVIISLLNITSDPVCGDVSYYVRKVDIMRITDTMRIINEFPHKLNGLTPNTNYIITIQPMSNAGIGEPYNKSITTAPNSKLITLNKMYVSLYTVSLMNFCFVFLIALVSTCSNCVSY